MSLSTLSASERKAFKKLFEVGPNTSIVEALRALFTDENGSRR